MNSWRILLIYLAIKYDGDYDAILQAAISKLNPDFIDVEQVVSKLTCKTLTLLDPDYPLYLKKMARPPLVLFYKGDISLIDDAHINSNLAVVGTRNPSDYGSFHTKRIVSEVADRVTIISGLAQGIDAIAHQAAIDAGGKTVAVLGSGIDYPWPVENGPLYDKIIESGGLVISEYPNKSLPMGFHFPTRNRLIAMFSKALLVTQGNGFKTGTSITVGFAQSYGKEVMCIPFPLEDTESFCNHLLYEGAALVRNGEDVLIDMDLEQIKINI